MVYLNLFWKIQPGKGDYLFEMGVPFVFYRDAGEPCTECPEYKTIVWGFQSAYYIIDIVIFLALLVSLYYILNKWFKTDRW